MIKISKQNNSLIVEGIDNVFYPNNGDNSYPLNSLIVVTDNSDMATFRSVATNDVLFSGLIQNITINGEVVTKDNIIKKFDAVSNSSTGGGGGGTVDAYTKSEADAKFASKDELTNVQTVANDADTKVDALTPRVEGVETTLGNKQDTLVSGTNIKTINNQSILGEGNLEISVDVDLTDYYTKEETDTKFASKHELTAVETVANGADLKADNATSRIESVETSLGNKQDTLVSGTNIKTINNQSILGEGNIEISDYYTKTEADEIFATTTEVNHQAADISALQTDMRGKQATLVSGENIKTINSESILGSGDIQINGVSDEQAQEIAKIPTIETELAQKANASDVPIVQTRPQGTRINYIYSSGNMISSDNSVVSNIKNSKADADTLNLEIYNWGGGIGRALKLPSATTTAAGVMSAADKTKLDSIPENIPTQTEVDNIASNVSALETAMGNKQDTLVSGTNIKTINSQSILGEGNIEITGGEVDLTNYYTKTEADGKFATVTVFNEQAANISALQTAMDGKQATLVSGENIKTINTQSILGSGDLTISGVSEEQTQEIAKIPTIETELAQKANVSDVPTVQTSINGNVHTYIYSDDGGYLKGHRVIANLDFKNSTDGKLNLRSFPWGDTNKSSIFSLPVPSATTTTAGVMSAADKTKLDSISNEWTGTQSEFDALTTKDNNIIYYVTE